MNIHFTNKPKSIIGISFSKLTGVLIWPFLLLFFLSIGARVQAGPVGVLETGTSLSMNDATQQNLDKTINGSVTDAQSGDPLPGVNVVVKGASTGTSTDANGHFSLSIPDNAESLVVSFIGYETQEIAVGSQNQFDIQLHAQSTTLDQLVVVGFGTEKREDLTGSISSITGAQLQEAATMNFQEAMQGRVSGVVESGTSGAPGSTPQIRIRGTGSITAGNEPLYVVDGLPLPDNTGLQGIISTQTPAFQPHNASALSGLNSNSIESMNVLKGPSATAIFGSRGSNGVVIITTKKGTRSAQKPQINFNAYGGVQSMINKPDLMNSQELIEYTEDARNNYYLQEYNPTDPSSPNYNPQYDPHTNAGRPANGSVLIPDQFIDWDGKTNTDWLDVVTHASSVQNYNLSVGGGGEASSYYVSGGYYKQNGILEGSSFKRYNLSTNLEFDLVPKKLTVGTHVYSSLSYNDRLPASAPYFGNPSGIIYSAMIHSPVFSPYNPDGTINRLNNQAFITGTADDGTVTDAGTTPVSNPLDIMNGVSDNISHIQLFGNAYAQLYLTPDLYFKTMIGGNIDSYDRKYYRAKSFIQQNDLNPNPISQQNSGVGFNWVSENTLNYSKDFGLHRLKLLAGYTAQRNRTRTMMVVADGFPDDQITTVNGGILSSGDGEESEWSLVSFLGRANYNYNDKYLVTASIRSDRSSRFGVNHQTGIFPSGAVAWRIENEPFMQNVNFISGLKLRTEYGLSGNFNIPNYASYSILGSSNYILGNQQIPGVGPITLGNKDLTWESTQSFNVGLDFGIIEDRIMGSVDVYARTTKDLLLDVTVPSAIGFQTVLTNIGKVRNRGLEFSITSHNVVGAFSWSTNLNMSFNKNTVLALGPDNARILTAGAAGVRHVTQVGSPIGSYFGYLVEGIYQTQDEVDHAPADELAPDARAGDLKFRDVNGDGKITSADRTVVGNYEPDYTFGFTNDFSYRNFDLSIFIDGVQGRDILNLSARHMKNGEANVNSYAIENDRWRSASEPGNGKIPRADRNNNPHGNNNRESSFQVEDGSFVRINKISLGYTLRNVSRVARNIRFYVQANNVHMFTDYIGVNPSVSLQQGNSLAIGEDYGAYPLSRTVTFGVNIDF